MRYSGFLVIGFAFLLSGCRFHDQMARIASPNGQLEAVVFESSGGAIDDVIDEVWVVPKGSHGGKRVAWFDDPLKDEHNYGVNVKWDSACHLAIEYLRAGRAELLIRKTVIAGQDVEISLRSNGT